MKAVALSVHFRQNADLEDGSFGPDNDQDPCQPGGHMRTSNLRDVRVDLIRDPATIVWIQRFLDGLQRPRPVYTTPRPGPDLKSTSTWFGAVDGHGAVLGCLRVIAAPDGRLPIAHDASIDEDARRALEGLKGQVSQVTDLALAPGAPSVATLSLLARSAVHHAVATGQHSYLVAEVSERIIRFLRSSLNLPCEIIGGPRRYSDGQQWWPVLIDGVRWLHDLRFERPDLWRWIVDDLVINVDEPQAEIDLTELI